MLGFHDNQKYDSISLVDYMRGHPSEDELRSVFLKMDKTLEYIHQHGYCIDIFYPTEILVLSSQNDSSKEIIFKKLMKLPIDEDMKRQLIREDILRSSLIQIGSYVYNSGI